VSALRPALFLDRDGTIIQDAHYLADATRVRLLHGAAQAIAGANARGVLTIVVTNQSGIARGLITAAQYEAVRAQTDRLLAREGAHVDATLHCPHSPEVSGPCECRKPGLSMYQEAAARFAIDLAASAYIGDRWRDVEPGRILGGFGFLIPGSETPEADLEHARTHISTRVHIVESISDAVARALSVIAPAVPS
jgi:histidinol-phosphate phosphatase family protein